MSTNEPVFFVEDADTGEPLGTVGTEWLVAAAQALACRLATVSGVEELDRVQEEALERFGPELYGGVAAHVLPMLVTQVLMPMRVRGVDPRELMRQERGEV